MKFKRFLIVALLFSFVFCSFMVCYAVNIKPDSIFQITPVLSPYPSGFIVAVGNNSEVESHNYTFSFDQGSNTLQMSLPSGNIKQIELYFPLSSYPHSDFGVFNPSDWLDYNAFFSGSLILDGFCADSCTARLLSGRYNNTTANGGGGVNVVLDTFAYRHFDNPGGLGMSISFSGSFTVTNEVKFLDIVFSTSDLYAENLPHLPTVNLLYSNVDNGNAGWILRLSQTPFQSASWMLEEFAGSVSSTADQIIDAGSDVDQPDFDSTDSELNSTKDKFDSVDQQFKVDPDKKNTVLSEGSTYFQSDGFSNAAIVVKRLFNDFIDVSPAFKSFLVSCLILGICFLVIGRGYSGSSS